MFKKLKTVLSKSYKKLNQFYDGIVYPAKLKRLRSKRTLIQDTTIDVEGSYFITSEKGVFYIHNKKIYHILNLQTYGIAIDPDRNLFFLSVYIAGEGYVLQGDLAALQKPDQSFQFKILYQRTIKSGSNGRIHGIYYDNGILYVANTDRNSILAIDPEKHTEMQEWVLMTDEFGTPILSDHYHINSVSKYGQFLFFVAYKVNGKSLLGFIDLNDHTYYGCFYPNTGVHDIFLTRDHLWFCDTFGDKTDEISDQYGYLIRDNAIFAEDFFSKGKGYITRGIAGDQDGELVIGHSHKGTRAKRFDGHGGLIICHPDTSPKYISMPFAQTYQVIREDGKFICPTPEKISRESIIKIMEKALEPFTVKGKPIKKM